MKDLIIALAMLGTVAAFARGPNDVNLNFGISTAEAQKTGFNSYVTAPKGVTLLEEDGVKFFRLEQDAADPQHRAKISFHAPRACKAYEKGSFNVSLLARTEANRTNGIIMTYIGCTRLDLSNSKANVVFMGKGKKFTIMSANYQKTPVVPGAWQHVHLSVNRQGDIAIYINGELSASRNMSDRQDEVWCDSIWWAVVGNNRASDADHPIAKMDVARLSIREGLMSSAQIKEEADSWLANVVRK